MSIRVYVLSKLLKIDSQEILEAIEELGIEGKMSQLAALTEEEVERVCKILPKPKSESSQCSIFTWSDGTTVELEVP
jgi:hypothetical protein